jgi:hypothetical protein
LIVFFDLNVYLAGLLANPFRKDIMIRHYFCPTSILLFIFFSAIPFLQSDQNEYAGSFLITNDTLHSGLGAEFSAVLGSLNLYETGNYAGLKIDFNSGLYLDPNLSGSNWWEYFFEPIVLGDENHLNKHQFDLSETCVLSGVGYTMSRARNFELIQKYIHVKPEIQQQVDNYYQDNFDGCYMIGVHHRGTDKAMEVSLVPYENTLKILRKEISKRPCCVIALT